MTLLVSWPDGERYLCSLQFLLVSLLLSLVSALPFSRTEGVLTHRIFLHIGPLDFHRGIYIPSSRLLCALFSAIDTAFRLALISLDLAESRIFHVAPSALGRRTLLISFWSVQQWTLYAARSLPTRCISTTSGPGPVKLLGFWDQWSSTMPSFPGRSRVATTTVQFRFTVLQYALAYGGYLHIIINLILMHPNMLNIQIRNPTTYWLQINQHLGPILSLPRR